MAVKRRGNRISADSPERIPEDRQPSEDDVTRSDEDEGLESIGRPAPKFDITKAERLGVIKCTCCQATWTTEVDPVESRVPIVLRRSIEDGAGVTQQGQDCHYVFHSGRLRLSPSATASLTSIALERIGRMTINGHSLNVVKGAVAKEPRERIWSASLHEVEEEEAAYGFAKLLGSHEGLLFEPFLTEEQTARRRAFSTYDDDSNDVGGSNSSSRRDAASSDAHDASSKPLAEVLSTLLEVAPSSPERRRQFTPDPSTPTTQGVELIADQALQLSSEARELSLGPNAQGLSSVSRHGSGSLKTEDVADVHVSSFSAKPSPAKAVANSVTSPLLSATAVAAPSTTNTTTTTKTPSSAAVAERTRSVEEKKRDQQVLKARILQRINSPETARENLRAMALLKQEASASGNKPVGEVKLESSERTSRPSPAEAPKAVEVVTVEPPTEHDIPVVHAPFSVSKPLMDIPEFERLIDPKLAQLRVSAEQMHHDGPKIREWTSGLVHKSIRNCLVWNGRLGANGKGSRGSVTESFASIDPLERASPSSVPCKVHVAFVQDDNYNAGAGVTVLKMVHYERSRAGAYAQQEKNSLKRRLSDDDAKSSSAEKERRKRAKRNRGRELEFLRLGLEVEEGERVVEGARNLRTRSSKRRSQQAKAESEAAEVEVNNITVDRIHERDLSASSRETTRRVKQADPKDKKGERTSRTSKTEAETGHSDSSSQEISDRDSMKQPPATAGVLIETPESSLSTDVETQLPERAGSGSGSPLRIRAEEYGKWEVKGIYFVVLSTASFVERKSTGTYALWKHAAVSIDVDKTVFKLQQMEGLEIAPAEEEEDDPSEEEDVPLKGYLQPSMRGGKKDSPFNIRTECVVKRAVRCLNTAKVAATCSIIYQKVEELFPESVKRLNFVGKDGKDWKRCIRDVLKKRSDEATSSPYWSHKRPKKKRVNKRPLFRAIIDNEEIQEALKSLEAQYRTTSGKNWDPKVFQHMKEKRKTELTRFEYIEGESTDDEGKGDSMKEVEIERSRERQRQISLHKGVHHVVERSNSAMKGSYSDESDCHSANTPSPDLMKAMRRRNAATPIASAPINRTERKKATVVSTSKESGPLVTSPVLLPPSAAGDDDDEEEMPLDRHLILVKALKKGTSVKPPATTISAKKSKDRLNSSMIGKARPIAKEAAPLQNSHYLPVDKGSSGGSGNKRKYASTVLHGEGKGSTSSSKPIVAPP